MTGRIAAVALLLLLAAPLHAEVMDKEMSIPDIWRSAIVPAVLAVAAALLNRWLLLLSFCVAIVLGPTFAWTEWHSESVGPAILREAGASYGLHANTAMAVVVLAHVAGWSLASHRRRRRLKRAGRWNPLLARRSSVHAVLFMGIIASLTALAASSGFGGGGGIWLSPPLLVSIIFLLFAAGLAARTHSRRCGEVV